MNFFPSNVPVKNIRNVALSGLTDEVFCRYIDTVYQKNDRSILIVTSSLFEANRLFDFLSNYQSKVYLFPMDDFLTSEAIATSPDLMVNRLETITSILENDKVIVITNLMGYLRFLPTITTYQENIKTFQVNQDFDPIRISKIFNEYWL